MNKLSRRIEISVPCKNITPNKKLITKAKTNNIIKSISLVRDLLFRYFSIINKINKHKKIKNNLYKTDSQPNCQNKKLSPTKEKILEPKICW